MLMVLVMWCYMAVTAFLTGLAVLAPFQKKYPRRMKHTTTYLMAGAAVHTVYAQYYSLFSRVSLEANVVMVLFCLAVLVFLRKQISEFLKCKKEETGWGHMLLYGFLVLLFAYGSSRGYMHYDTNLYHAQSIRWIEEYGAVPGLANLHCRFGYNSAAFAYCALFGGAGLTRYPMHCGAGFFALICAFRCCDLTLLLKEKKLRPSHFARVGCIFYLVTVFRELVAPASDYFAILSIFFILITWLELLEEKEKSPIPYGLLSLLLVYTVTVKLSAAVLLLFALYPAYLLIKGKDWKNIFLFIGTGIVIAIPYLARNMIISGWLFYPFTLFDVFKIDWQVPKGTAASDAKEIAVYGKGIYDVLKADTPFKDWFPAWFFSQTSVDKVLILSGFVSAALELLVFAWDVFSKHWEKMELHFYCLVMTAGFFFWQFSAPLVRYGYVYIIMLPMAVLGGLYCRWFTKKRALRAFELILVAFLAYKSYNLFNMVLEFKDQQNYIWQQDYTDGPAETYEVDGITVYVPTDRGQIGYNKFPSSPVVQDIELRGEGLEDGFRVKGLED